MSREKTAKWNRTDASEIFCGFLRAFSIPSFRNTKQISMETILEFRTFFRCKLAGYFFINSWRDHLVENMRVLYALRVSRWVRFPFQKGICQILPFKKLHRISSPRNHYILRQSVSRTGHLTFSWRFQKVFVSKYVWTIWKLAPGQLISISYFTFSALLYLFSAAVSF